MYFRIESVELINSIRLEISKYSRHFTVDKF